MNSMPQGFYDDVAKNIRETGRSIIVTVGWSYTIGNYLRGLPEILALGNVDPRQLSGMLNALSEKMIARGYQFTDNESVDLGGKFPVVMIEAGYIAKRDFTIQAGQFFRHDDYSVLQAVLCDPAGRYPWDEGCRQEYRVAVLRSLS